MKKNFGGVLGILAILLCMSMLLFGCGNENSPETTEAAADVDTAQSQTAAQTEPATEAPTEAGPVYETQTVYLCTLETMKQYENGAVFQTAHTYDEYGRLKESWQVEADGSKGYTTEYTYDEFGNLISEGSIHRTYDEAGNMLSQCFGDEGDYLYEYHFTYDEAGFPIEEIRITRYGSERTVTYSITYNEDHTESMVEGFEDGVKTGYTKETYSTDGDLLSYYNYDANGSFTSGCTYEYDDAGRLLLEQRYSGSETQADYDVVYTYDENGLLLSKNTDYYYGNLIEYTYEAFEILVLVEK